MCNLSQGIVDDTKVEVITNIVLNMYENHDRFYECASRWMVRLKL